MKKFYIFKVIFAIVLLTSSASVLAHDNNERKEPSGTYTVQGKCMSWNSQDMVESIANNICDTLNYKFIEPFHKSEPTTFISLKNSIRSAIKDNHCEFTFRCIDEDTISWRYNDASSRSPIIPVVAN
jgi:hypothetical protein